MRRAIPGRLATGPRLLSILTVLLLTVVLAACGSEAEDEGSSGSTPASAEPAATTEEAGGEIEIETVGLALNGPRNDRGFFQQHHEGAVEAQEELGFELNVVDSLEEPQAQIDAFTNLARAGNDVVVGGGGVFYQAAEAIAAQFPDTYFIVTQGATQKLYDNVTGISPDQAYPAYVAGQVMAKLSKSGKIGVLGGLEIPPTVQNYLGIKQGAEAANPDIEVLNTVVGSFSDAAKAQSAAKAQIDEGADVLFAFLDAGFPGVAKAAEGKDVLLLGSPAERCEESDQYVGTTLSNNAKLVSNALRDLSEGKLEPGAKYYAVDDPSVQTFKLCPKYDEPELADVVQKGLDDLNSGTVTLPPEALHARPEYYEGP